ncbi:MAG: amidophosphoribosyltransferase, partial [Verrucomicrobiae bacterium]|nr:amidophosphoribosyltransferase [Verrucomicrobiae bacterium]
GDAFVLRDPNGIRPVHYFENDEVIAFASERVPLMTVFGCEAREVRELEPGHVATMKKRERTKPGCDLKIERFKKRGAFTPCSFERIYFSRGNDPDIYRERKSLGEALVPQILDAIGGNLEKTVFSFIPNTAEVAYHGMMDGLRLFRRDEVKQSILAAANSSGGLTEELIDDLILRNWPRGEKVAHKDIKLRTFISQERGRDQMVSHVYDITYGAVEKSDNLVVLDDSIVRGTTLEKSILNILARTNPRKIVIASTAPQIRYPDCYGIDMSKLKGFVAFRAAVSLHRKKDRKLKILDEVYGACRGELKRWDDAKKKDPMAEVLLENPVQHLYEPFTDEQISAEIAELVRPEKLSWKGDIQMIFQTIENLHRAIPIHHGDWYFTGNYPTPGGFRVVNQAFVGFFEGKDERPYDSLLF